MTVLERRCSIEGISIRVVNSGDRKLLNPGRFNCYFNVLSVCRHVGKYFRNMEKYDATTLSNHDDNAKCMSCLYECLLQHCMCCRKLYHVQIEPKIDQKIELNLQCPDMFNV